MKSLIKKAIYGAPKMLGVYAAYRRKNRGNALVLTYHGILPSIPENEPEYEYRNFVTVDQFDAQIAHLLKYYRPLRAEDFCNPDSDLSGGFLITFDDGFRNNYRYAVPVLQKYGVQGCFFITTNLIGSRKFLWTEEVTRMLQNTQMPSLSLSAGELGRFDLSSSGGRETASNKIRKAFKMMPPASLQTAMDEMKSQLSDVSLEINLDEEERYLMMTWEEVRGMLKAGQAIGSHTHNHPMLATLPEADSWDELKLSRDAIESELGIKCLTMSYPNGERENFSDLQKRQLKELGYQCAFSQIPLFNSAATDRFELRRFNISLKMNLALIEAKLSGAPI